VSRRIARPYAAALFQVMEKQGTETLREVESQLAAIAELFEREAKLLRAFETPAVSPAKKQRLLAELGEAVGLRRESQRMLAALAQHYRLRFLPDVVAAFRELVDRREGIVRGRADFPTPPSEVQLAGLAEALQDLLGERVDLRAEVKPELLAGFVVRVGSRVYDGSLRSQLARFARMGRGR
jgi:F-type H+-transporting ATPase subunit delta